MCMVGGGGGGSEGGRKGKRNNGKQTINWFSCLSPLLFLLRPFLIISHSSAFFFFFCVYETHPPFANICFALCWRHLGQFYLFMVNNKNCIPFFSFAFSILSFSKWRSSKRKRCWWWKEEEWKKFFFSLFLLRFSGIFIFKSWRRMFFSFYCRVLLLLKLFMNAFLVELNGSYFIFIGLLTNLWNL